MSMLPKRLGIPWRSLEVDKFVPTSQDGAIVWLVCREVISCGGMHVSTMPEALDYISHVIH